MTTRELFNKMRPNIPAIRSNIIQIFSEEFIFDKTAYDPSRLSTLLSKKEFNIIISELNKIVTKSFIKKNKSERIKVYRFLYFLLAVVALFFIFGSFSLFQAEEFNSKNHKDLNLAYVIGIVLFSLMLIIILGLSWYNFKHITYQMTTLEDTIHNFIKQYIGFLNVYFQGVLNWVYHQKIVMIEIQILNFEDDEGIASQPRNLIFKKKREYIDDILEVFEEDNDDIGKEIERRLYGKNIKEEFEYRFFPEDSDSDLSDENENFELSKKNLKKVIRKNKSKRKKILDNHEKERFEAQLRKSHST